MTVSFHSLLFNVATHRVRAFVRCMHQVLFAQDRTGQDRTGYGRPGQDRNGYERIGYELQQVKIMHGRADESNQSRIC